MDLQDEEYAASENAKPKCCFCQKEFRSNFSVLRHQRAAHPLWLNSKCIACDICNKLFSKPLQVLRHKQLAHKLDKSSLNEVPNTRVDVKTYECNLCHRKFSSSASHSKHLKIIHNAASRFQRKLACSECESVFQSRVGFVKHAKTCHNILITSEKLQFESSEDFEKWKLEIEKNTVSKYIQHYGWKTSSGLERIHFVCRCSGHCKSMRKRSMKKKGTIKSKYFCPARILVESKQIGKCFPADVRYCSLHLGHPWEIRNSPPVQEEKDQNACQRLFGVPMENTLQKRSVEASLTKQLVPTNMQDPGKPENEINKEGTAIMYGLNSGMWNTDTVSSVGVLVLAETSPIILPKSPGEISNKFLQLQTELNTPLLSNENVEEQRKDSLNIFMKEAARNAVMSFLHKLEEFTLEEQYREIIKTMSALRTKCDTLKSRSNAHKLPITTNYKRIIPRPLVPLRKKICKINNVTSLSQSSSEDSSELVSRPPLVIVESNSGK